MTLQTMHREDVKAAIRKAHGSQRNFEKANNLAPNAVSEVLRGRTSRPTTEAIEKLLEGVARESIKLDDSANSAPAHRLNGRG